MVPLAYVFFSNWLDRVLLGVTGCLVACYTLHVEVQAERNPRYRAICDFSENVSCSKVLTSSYARGFGLVARYLGKDHVLNMRNCNLGIVFYLLHIYVVLFVSPVTHAPILLVMSVASVLTSVYLGVILFVILRDICVVCITTYVINGLLLYLNYSLYYSPRETGWSQH